MSNPEQNHTNSDSDSEDNVIIKNIATTVELKLVANQLETKSISYAVVNRMDRIIVEGLFTTRAAAHAHMIRLAINAAMADCIECARSNAENNEPEDELTEENFRESVMCEIPENFKLYILDHLDITQPMYKITTRTNNMLHFSDITKSLTNSLETWQGVMDVEKKKCPTIRNWMDSGKWLEYCTLKINPPLPKLKPKTY